MRGGILHAQHRARRRPIPQSGPISDPLGTPLGHRWDTVLLNKSAPTPCAAKAYRPGPPGTVFIRRSCCHPGEPATSDGATFVSQTNPNPPGFSKPFLTPSNPPPHAFASLDPPSSI